MIHAIPNPTKTISIPVNVNTVRETVKNLNPLMTKLGYKGYNLSSSDDFMGVYVFNKSETLSLGVNITITVQEMNNSTQIHIEVARVLGSFDQWYEVTNANRHIEALLKCISLGLDPNADKRIQEEEEKKKEQEKLAEQGTPILIGFGILVAFLLYAVS